MPAILAPSPRRPIQPSLLLSSPSPRACLPRLMSPIRLHDPPYVALKPKSPTPCGPPHKRRAASRLLARSSRRRRHPQRVDCPFDAFGRQSIFDQLPWISALEVPSPVHCDPADLSQLLLDQDSAPYSDAVPASGPVRRRKTSLRSNPLWNGPEPPRQRSPAYHPTGPPPDCPRTPSPRVPFDPSNVTFHHLMPVFPRGINPSTPF